MQIFMNLMQHLAMGVKTVVRTWLNPFDTMPIEHWKVLHTNTRMIHPTDNFIVQRLSTCSNKIVESLRE